MNPPVKTPVLLENQLPPLWRGSYFRAFPTGFLVDYLYSTFDTMVAISLS